MKRFLLLALCLSCRTVEIKPKPELPPIPTQVYSQLGPVPVIWVDSLTNAQGEQMLGGFHTIRRTIYLRRSLQANPRMAYVVFRHEVCHVWMQDSGLSEAMPVQVQQQVCDASAIHTVAEMITQAKR